MQIAVKVAKYLKPVVLRDERKMSKDRKHTGCPWLPL